MPSDHEHRPESAIPAKGPRELKEEVLDAGRCTSCGMCLGLCPYLEEMGENVAFITDCRGDQGRCHAVCPRTETDLDALRNAYVPQSQPDYVLGNHHAVFLSRARDEATRQKGQYGGTVTALALFGLETGRLDASLVTGWSTDPEETLQPQPRVARSREELLAAAGSKYTACPTLKILDKTIAHGAEKLLVVARPCQVLGLRKRMSIEDPAFQGDRVALVIGLFCMWSVSLRDFKALMAPLLEDRKLLRLDIPQGRFVAETDRGPLSLDHDALRECSRSACEICYDFTAELADLSVGSTEWKDDWNTLIVRSEKARSYVQAAADQGWIELEAFPEDREKLLREAAYNKKKRVLSRLREEAEERPTALYLKLSAAEQEYFLGR